jgi:hypothetical protein
MGMHTFMVTLNTAGSQTVTVEDASNHRIKGKKTVPVGAAAAARLATALLPEETLGSLDAALLAMLRSTDGEPVAVPLADGTTRHEPGQPWTRQH